jgi:2-methylisocitrate lyase-like PEP mutase family enzyme
MTPTQSEKALAFRALHAQTFVIPNPWDAGSARVLASLGFKALATTSAGHAYTLGRRDGEGGVSRDETLANAKAIVEATDLPVSADLENGFGDRPEDVIKTIRAAPAAGLAAGRSRMRPATLPADLRFRTWRSNASPPRSRRRGPARSLRADGAGGEFPARHRDLDDTIKRLQAFEKAGAEVSYAPALGNLDNLRAVCSSVSRPVNALAGGADLSVQQLAEAGARRISLGSSLARIALSALLRAGEEIRDHGTFGFAKGGASYGEIDRLMRGKAHSGPRGLFI